MTSHSELIDQVPTDLTDTRLPDEETDSVSPKKGGVKKLLQNGQVQEFQPIEISDPQNLAVTANEGPKQGEIANGVGEDNQELGNSKKKINSHTVAKIVENSTEVHERSNGQTVHPEKMKRNGLVDHELLGGSNEAVSSYPTKQTINLAQQVQYNDFEVLKSGQIALESNAVSQVQQDTHLPSAQIEADVNSLTTSSPLILSDSTKTESSGSNQQGKPSSQDPKTTKLKGCLCPPHDLTTPRNTACAKQVHFKEEAEEIFSCSPVYESKNSEEFIEMIPTDKLDNMTSTERFSEYDHMIEKGISLKNRHRLEQAANVFEIAVDIINPIYFRDSPTMHKQAQKNLIVGLLNAATCHFAAERYNDACKNAHPVLKLEPFNLEAIYYYGASKMKLGDVNEAARVFLMAKRVSSESAIHVSFRGKITSQLTALLRDNPGLDIKKIEESVDSLFPLKKKPSHKRAFIFASVGFVPAVVVVYFLTTKMKMPRRRRLFTSISSGILVSVLSFLLEKLI